NLQHIIPTQTCLLMKACLIFFLTLASFLTSAQITVYPPHWWTGMKHSEIQLLVRSSDPIASETSITLNYPGIEVRNVTPLENPRYVTIDLRITPEAKPGKPVIEFKHGRKSRKASWGLNARTN